LNASSIIRFTILFFIINGCSSVTNLKGVSSRMEKPELVTEATIQPEAPLVFDEKDYKSRKTSKKKPFFTFAPILFPAGFNNELIAIFHQENRLFWQNTESKEVKLPIDAWKSQENLRKEFKEQDIDSFINTELAFDGEILKVKQTFIDPVNQKEYGSIDYDIAVIFPGQPDSKAKLELYKSENNFKVLEEIKVPILKFIKRPDRNLQIALLRSTVSAHLNVSSSSSDTIFYFDGKEVSRRRRGRGTKPALYDRARPLALAHRYRPRHHQRGRPRDLRAAAAPAPQVDRGPDRATPARALDAPGDPAARAHGLRARSRGRRARRAGPRAQRVGARLEPRSQPRRRPPRPGPAPAAVVAADGAAPDRSVSRALSARPARRRRPATSRSPRRRGCGPSRRAAR
jgi:hypothetical protein